ncbi:MAG TPA: hypothetical protein VFJ76_07895 [Solirubrobacterales bacterium]|nr:hypothetical protein [Solirubrobacterales bacterium]
MSDRPYRDGDKLRHLNGGGLWEVLEYIGGPGEDFRCKCIEEGPGSTLGRVENFHLEYMERSFRVEAGIGPDRRRVVVRTIDIDTDEVLDESRMCPDDDYVIVTGPKYEVAALQRWPSSGTTQLTIKRRPQPEQCGGSGEGRGQ